jgi:hypothetical protein
VSSVDFLSFRRENLWESIFSKYGYLRVVYIYICTHLCEWRFYTWICLVLKSKIWGLWRKNPLITMNSRVIFNSRDETGMSGASKTANKDP